MKLELKLETAEDVRDIAIKVNYVNKKSEVINMTPSGNQSSQATKTTNKHSEPTKKVAAPKEFSDFKV